MILLIVFMFQISDSVKVPITKINSLFTLYENLYADYRLLDTINSKKDMYIIDIKLAISKADSLLMMQALLEDVHKRLILEYKASIFDLYAINKTKSVYMYTAISFALTNAIWKDFSYSTGMALLTFITFRLDIL
jgi:hypothetical protein